MRRIESVKKKNLFAKHDFKALVLKLNLVATHLLCRNFGALIEVNVKNLGSATHCLGTSALNSVLNTSHCGFNVDFYANER